MTTTKKMLLTISLIFSSIGHAAVSLENFDNSLLTPYVEKAQHAFSVAHETIQWQDHGSREILVTGKPIAKKLYKEHKAILKQIKKELKDVAQQQKDNNSDEYLKAQQLYKAFKHRVCKAWKKSVKERYQESKKNKNNDPFEWGWIHCYSLMDIIKTGN